MRWPLLLFIFIGSMRCADRPIRVELRAPNPNGCYVIVYERPDYQGAGEVLDGPVRLRSLERVPLTKDEDWRNRIRSLRVGRAAIVSVYVNVDFTGDSRLLPPGTEQPRIENALAAGIESLQVSCQ